MNPSICDCCFHDYTENNDVICNSCRNIMNSIESSHSLIFKRESSFNLVLAEKTKKDSEVKIISRISPKLINAETSLMRVFDATFIYEKPTTEHRLLTEDLVKLLDKTFPSILQSNWAKISVKAVDKEELESILRVKKYLAI